jgi:hypothetical protein
LLAVALAALALPAPLAFAGVLLAFSFDLLDTAAFVAAAFDVFDFAAFTAFVPFRIFFALDFLDIPIPPLQDECQRLARNARRNVQRNSDRPLLNLQQSSRQFFKKQCH